VADEPCRSLTAHNHSLNRMTRKEETERTVPQKFLSDSGPTMMGGESSLITSEPCIIFLDKHLV
jgi:hypothetical protein